MSQRFKEVCQRGLQDLPDLPCKNGLNAINNEGSKACQCPWYVNSKISSYCWFKYAKLIGQSGGKIYEHTLEEVAQLDNCTPTYIKILENKALLTLKKKINYKKPTLKKMIDEQ